MPLQTHSFCLSIWELTVSSQPMIALQTLLLIQRVTGSLARSICLPTILQSMLAMDINVALL